MFICLFISWPRLLVLLSLICWFDRGLFGAWLSEGGSPFFRCQPALVSMCSVRFRSAHQRPLTAINAHWPRRFRSGGTNFFGSPTSRVPVVPHLSGFRLVRGGIANVGAVFVVVVLVLFRRVRPRGPCPGVRPGPGSRPRGRGPGLLPSRPSSWSWSRSCSVLAFLMIVVLWLLFSLRTCFGFCCGGGAPSCVL